VEVGFPDGAKFWTDRDRLGRAVGGYQGPLGSTAMAMVGFTFDSASQLYRTARRWGSATNPRYDGAKRLAGLENGFAGDGGTVSTFAYSPAGQLRSETRSNDSYAWTGSIAADRTYAANGQNQYTSAGSATFGYDPNGNLVSTVNAPWSTTYTYDVENRLVQASGTHNLALRYDPLGRLFQTQSPESGAIVQFLHDGDELAAEYNAVGGGVLRRYIHGDGDDDPLSGYEGADLGPRRPTGNMTRWAWGPVRARLQRRRRRNGLGAGFRRIRVHGSRPPPGDAGSSENLGTRGPADRGVPSPAR
jgi:YD repeat-containing protein